MKPTVIWVLQPHQLPCYCYGPILWDYISMDLANFSLFFILSDCFRLWTMRRFSKGTHLSHALHHSTNTCLPHGEPCLIKLNFILDSSFPCCAWLCCHTHALSSCYASSSILSLPCGCIMLLISTMPALDSISRFNTNMYIHTLCQYIKTKESTGNPSLILLEFHPSNQTWFNSPTFVSGLHCLVNDLRHWFALLGCFIRIRLHLLPHLIHFYHPPCTYKPVRSEFL